MSLRDKFTMNRLLRFVTPLSMKMGRSIGISFHSKLIDPLDKGTGLKPRLVVLGINVEKAQPFIVAKRSNSYFHSCREVAGRAFHW